MKRHRFIMLQSPEHLQLSQVRCCTLEAFDEWHAGFNQFLMTHGLKKVVIWNADKSGFPLCPKVIAICNSHSVNSITSDTKQQMTTLCAVNAAGDIVPPTHIFSGERYKSNPMEGCVHTLGGHQMVGYQQSYFMVDQPITL